MFVCVWFAHLTCMEVTMHNSNVVCSYCFDKCQMCSQEYFVRMYTEEASFNNHFLFYFIRHEENDAKHHDRALDASHVGRTWSH